MRLSVFYYPLQGWIDAVVMNVLMGLATNIQLEELSRVSYQPLSEVFRAIAPREGRHTELGIAGLKRIAGNAGGFSSARASIAYWYPKVASSFGHSNSSRFETQSRFGLRHTSNEALLARWEAAAGSQLASLGLN